jgi:hypothetical protein
MNAEIVQKTGRKPPSRNDPRVQVLLANLEQGQFLSTACDAAGIHRSTVARWVKRGEEAQVSMEIDGDEIDVSELAYCDISDTIKKAQGTAQSRALTIIQEAAISGTWQAAAWYLERAHPQRWGRFSRTETDEMPSGVPRETPTAKELMVEIEAHIENEVRLRLEAAERTQHNREN